MWKRHQGGMISTFSDMQKLRKGRLTWFFSSYKLCIYSQISVSQTTPQITVVYNNNNIHLFSFKIRICRVCSAVALLPAAFHVSYSQTYRINPLWGFAYYHGWKKGQVSWQYLTASAQSWHRPCPSSFHWPKRITWPRPAWLEQWSALLPQPAASHITLLQGRIAVKKKGQGISTSALKRCESQTREVFKSAS